MSLEDRLYGLIRLYERMPDPLRNLAGSLYRVLPSSVRYGPSYAAFSRHAAELETASPDELWAYHRNRLRDVLTHASQTCPLYRTRFDDAGFDPSLLNEPADLERCPVLEKSDLQQHLPELLSDAHPESKRLYITTGGSTGVPVGFYLHKGISRPKEQAFLEAMWARAGYRPGDRMAVIRGMVTSGRTDGRIHYMDPTRNWLILSSYHLTEDRLDAYLDLLARYRPRFLHAYPSAALMLAGYLERTGRTCPVSLTAILCGSEQMPLQQKRMVEETFGCRVYRWYGHAERAVLAGEGRTSSRLYFFPTYGYTEFGPPDEEGYREVIATSYDNLVMPLIRYRTGDLVKLASGGDFEYPWPAADAVMGRKQEFLVSASGRRISLTAFNMHDDIFDGLYAVQFVQHRKGEAVFRYQPARELGDERVRMIERRIREKLGDDFDIRMECVRDVEKTARGKHRWLVSTIDESATGGAGGDRTV